jgi:hypothetical protein
MFELYANDNLITKRTERGDLLRAAIQLRMAWFKREGGHVVLYPGIEIRAEPSRVLQ